MTINNNTVFVPVEPVCCDDYVVVKYVGRDNVVVDFPCGTEHVFSASRFNADYRLMGWSDTDAVASVQKNIGVAIS